MQGRGIGVGAALVVLEKRHALIVDIDVVAEDAYGDDGEQVGQAPVAPVVTGRAPPLATVLPRPVAAAEEVECLGIPNGEHPPFVLLEILTAPALVVAHQLGGLREGVAVEAGGEERVGVASDAGGGSCPCHHNAHGGIGILFRATDLPAKRVLIGCCGTAGGVHVVLAGSATNHRFGWRRAYGGLGVGRAGQLGVGSLYGLVA